MAKKTCNVKAFPRFYFCWGCWPMVYCTLVNHINDTLSLKIRTRCSPVRRSWVKRKIMFFHKTKQEGIFWLFPPPHTLFSSVFLPGSTKNPVDGVLPNGTEFL
jgi:hypothetical protein